MNRSTPLVIPAPGRGASVDGEPGTGPERVRSRDHGPGPEREWDRMRRRLQEREPAAGKLPAAPPPSTVAPDRLSPAAAARMAPMKAVVEQAAERLPAAPPPWTVVLDRALLAGAGQMVPVKAVMKQVPAQATVRCLPRVGPASELPTEFRAQSAVEGAPIQAQTASPAQVHRTARSARTVVHAWEADEAGRAADAAAESARVQRRSAALRPTAMPVTEPETTMCLWNCRWITSPARCRTLSETAKPGMTSFRSGPCHRILAAIPAVDRPRRDRPALAAMKRLPGRRRPRPERPDPVPRHRAKKEAPREASAATR